MGTKRGLRSACEHPTYENQTGPMKRMWLLFWNLCVRKLYSWLSRELLPENATSLVCLWQCCSLVDLFSRTAHAPSHNVHRFGKIYLCGGHLPSHGQQLQILLLRLLSLDFTGIQQSVWFTSTTAEGQALRKTEDAMAFRWLLLTSA
jgi:hypothetical protein